MITKYLQKLVDKYKYPVLLVFKEKYGPEYYLVKDKDALYRAALEVLDARVKEGWIQQPEKAPYGLKQVLPDDEYNALPENYRAIEAEKRTTNDKKWQFHNEDVKRWEEVNRALKEKDGATAYQLLYDRRDYEYEGFDVEEPRTP